MYVEKRRRVWYALHTVPLSLRKAVGKVRLVASLETEDRATAERRAAVMKVQWLSKLAKARTGTGEHLAADAEFWRKAIESAPDEQRELIRDMLGDEAQTRVDRATQRAGIADDKDRRYQELPELQEATRFVRMATGQLLPMTAHLDDWIATLREEQKTSAMKRATVLEFAESLPFVQDVTRKGVQKWIGKLSADGLHASTIRRKLAKVRGYWSYLVSIQAAPEDNTAFEKLSMPRGSAKGEQRQAR